MSVSIKMEDMEDGAWTKFPVDMFAVPPFVERSLDLSRLALWQTLRYPATDNDVSIFSEMTMFKGRHFD